MRSFFKRPSWASKGDEPVKSDFYRRAGQIYGDIITTNREARERSDCRNKPAAEDGRARKRHHVLDDGSLEENTSLGLDGGFEHNILSKSQQECASSKLTPSPCDTLAEESIDSELQRPATTYSGVLDISGNVHQDHDSDLTLLASAQRCRMNFKDSSQSKMKRESKSMSTNERLDHQREARGQKKAPGAGIHQISGPRSEDVIVQILITSPIEGTKPLIVHRKMSQSLRDVRLAWCNRQNLSTTVQASIYLTWKGRRLFDVTTCRSLGLDISETPTDDEDIDKYSQMDGKPLRIHMEAVTDKLVAPDTQRLSPVLGSQSKLNEGPDQKPLVRLVLKCPGFDKFETSVASNGPISQAITAFRLAKRIPSERKIQLVFDGDLLNPNAFFTDYDITDDDLVDVLIK
ncbi:protein ESC2 [Aspergillus udagawae]|uniref:Protein ESC2 n=1 Tax=Aspergillus udagawae TaxID=91492 RepID=A0ABQ1AXP9_9EURO|nr:protein ESC2 [Aspergillus udagawae]